MTASVPEVPGGAYPWMCHINEHKTDAAVLAAADQVMVGIYPTLRGAKLGLDLTWAEDPYHDRNWQFDEQTARFTYDLMEAWHLTGTVDYRDRALAILLDWVKDNPRVNPPSEFSWTDHGVALRATVLACAYRELDGDADLRPVLQAHAKLLADPTFYKGYGNHALNQSIGLLDAAGQLGSTVWRDLAIARMSTLLSASVDAQGVTNEQAVAYQYYNYQAYAAARRRIRDLGLNVPSVFARIDLMPNFLAHATLPNGEYEMIGDTDREAAIAIPGTTAQYAATFGATGPRPTSTVAFYYAGYLFARSGWGVTRPYKDEVDVGVHYGPARYIHGHDDQGSVTLYGYGSKLILDPGKYTYNQNAWSAWFKSRAAHNVVTVDGLAWSKTQGMTLLSKLVHSRVIDARFVGKGYAGVTMHRRVTYSRKLDWLVVEDRITSTTTRTFRQLWHLAPGSNPVIGTSGVVTRVARGNVVIRQLAGKSTVRILTGRTSPIQGWQAGSFGQKMPAPAVEYAQRGRSIRYLTLIVPGATAPRVRVSNLVLLADGYSMTITVNGRSERIRVNGTSVSIGTP